MIHAQFSLELKTEEFNFRSKFRLLKLFGRLKLVIFCLNEREDWPLPLTEIL